MKKVVIVGVGALGSHVAQFLRNVAELRVVDFDRVEQKNVASQFHAKASLGKTKVLALQQSMQFLFGTKLEAIPHKLTVENAEAILGSAELIVDCLDNGAGRRVLQNFARAKRVPCLHGALAADGSFGRVIWDEDFAIDDEPSNGSATCENGEHLPLIALVSAYVARAVQEYLVAQRKLSFSVAAAGPANAL